MPVYLGDNEIRPIYLGDTEICKVYLGDVLIYDCEDGGDPANQPPTIGDIDLYVKGGVETPITYETIVFNAAPPYNDPEGDLFDAMRIDYIDADNKGYFYINGVAIKVNDIITREQLQDPDFEFVHIGNNSTDIDTDHFLFAVRDEVNQTWVS